MYAPTSFYVRYSAYLADLPNIRIRLIYRRVVFGQSFGKMPTFLPNKHNQLNYYINLVIQAYSLQRVFFQMYLTIKKNIVGT